jgi:hypothetical protein
MLNINWYIQVGNYKLTTVDSINIVNSVEQLNDTCIIKLPATTINKTENIEPYVKRGSKIIIKAGYDDSLLTEFEGYVIKHNIKKDGIEIECEDGIFELRKKVPNKQFGATSIKSILQYCISSIGFYLEVITDFDFTYEKFTIHEATAYDVLKKIQEDTKANVYVINNKELHIHPAYTEKFGEVTFDLSGSVDEIDLEYKQGEDRKIQVEITCTNKKGEILKATTGSEDGEKITINKGTQYNLSGLQLVANEELKKAKYGGYQGSLTSWLIPFVQAGYTCNIVDDDYPYQNGKYYIKKVDTTISASGGVRKIEIGRRLSA